MTEPTDEDLLNAIFVGDARAFEQFFNRHLGRVVAYAVKKGLQREDAKDVAQEAFTKLSSQIRRYEKGRAALPWFFTIVHNTCLDSLRAIARRKRKEQINAEETKLSSSMIAFNTSDLETSEHVETQFLKLTKEQREVVTMRIEQDLTYSEISERTGRSEGALKKLYQRAIDSLRRAQARKERSDDSERQSRQDNI